MRAHKLRMNAAECVGVAKSPMEGSANTRKWRPAILTRDGFERDRFRRTHATVTSLVGPAPPGDRGHKPLPPSSRKLDATRRETVARMASELGRGGNEVETE